MQRQTRGDGIPLEGRYTKSHRTIAADQSISDIKPNADFSDGEDSPIKGESWYLDVSGYLLFLA